MFECKKFDIPEKVSGRTVTNRGVHLQPFGYHGQWLDNASYWVDLMVSMGISWVVMLTEGDSVLEERHGTTPAKVLLDAGIIPIIRDKRLFPFDFLNMDTVRRTVDLYAKYDLRPFWQLYNEPFDGREWHKEKVPGYDEAWHTIASCWAKGARQIVDAGAYVGFPDGPCYAENPFERLRAADGLAVFDEGMAFYAPHCYGKGRPLWYPYDAVTRHGAHLTEEAYRRLLDDYAHDPSWYDAPPALLNVQRDEWVDPERTAIDDDTCWRGWEKIVYWAVESLGYVPPLAMTEGGWTPRDRAGSVPVDVRWPYTTPVMVAKKTLHMYDAPSPFFAICPWLLADQDMGGSGWPFEAWHGWAYNEKYGEKKPVITTLQQIPPKEVEPRAVPTVLCVEGDTRDWVWLHKAYGAGCRRGETTLRLIEVHEYEGPATLDVLVVDADGLPVEGVPFYYYHPAAPSIPPSADTGDTGEWYDRGVLQVTAGDGRISFAVPAESDPCLPGACQGAIWPQGKGDVLENLGLLAGTRNRHLNGVWQLVKEGTPPLVTDPGTTDPGTTDPGTTDPGTTDPGTTDPGTTDPGTTDPGTTDPGTTDPGTTDPGTATGVTLDSNVKAFIAQGLVTLDLTGEAYKLDEAVWMDVAASAGLHHIFLDLVDGDGQRLAGGQFRVSWSDGQSFVIIEEKQGESWGGSFPMFAPLGHYDVRAVGPAGTSDAVLGLGSGTRQEPAVQHPTSFGLRFRKVSG